MSSLLPSQERAAESIEQILTDAPDAVVIVNGCSGLGKSTIVSSVAARSNRTIVPISAWGNPEKYSDALAVDEYNEHNRDFLETVAEVRALAWRTLVLSKPKSDIEERLAAANIPSKAISLEPLEPSEIDTYIASTHPEATATERGLLHSHSLGIPLLLERMTKSAPVTKRVAETVLGGYIGGLINTHGLLRGETDEDVQENVRQFLRTHLKKPPEGLDWPAIMKSSWEFNTPLSVMNKARVPNAVPKCEATVERYEAWMRDKEAAMLSIFLPSTEGKTSTIMQELGLDDRDIVSDYEGRLRAFGGNGRKVAFFRTDKSTYGRPMVLGFEGRHLNAQFLDLFLQAQSLGSCDYFGFGSGGDGSGNIDIKESADPLLLTSYDHEGLYHNPLCIGLGAETYLQSKGISYQVRYGMGDVFSYDPVTNTLQKCMDADTFNKPHTSRWEHDED